MQVANVADWALWNWKSSFTSLLFNISTCNFDISHYIVFYFIVLYYLLYTLFFLWQTSACEKVIRRDIARTYPEHDFFREKDGLGQESLFNVMKVWSCLVYVIYALTVNVDGYRGSTVTMDDEWHTLHQCTSVMPWTVSASWHWDRHGRIGECQ